MTKSFDTLYESIISEVVVGSKKRNRIGQNNPRMRRKHKPGMGRKGGRLRDADHITAMPRQIKKHAAHIRPVGKTIGNETGKHSKDPLAKPVYGKGIGGMKLRNNPSQRGIATKRTGNPYSSNHFDNATDRRIMDRMEKVVKNVRAGK